MIRIRDISMPPEHNADQLLYEAARQLKISASRIRNLLIIRRSVDARKKPDIRIIYTVDATVEGNESKITRQCGSKRVTAAPKDHYKPPVTGVRPAKRPVVVGFGPAGMFAALILAQAGLRPLVLERGEDALTRSAKVEDFFSTGILDPESNVQFGEGGAGTFSDGKLNTGVNNVRIRWILEQFVKAGARENILYDAKPHIGTDILLTVVQNLRKRIIDLGGEVHFRAKVTGLIHTSGSLSGLVLQDGSTIECDHAIFAIGHSARDTFRMLYGQGIPMEPKPFAMGVRIEHPQILIDQAQYGSADLPLPPADYKLVAHLCDTTVYSFCMCPGGYVVAAASEPDSIVTNGMSYADRDGQNANAALLVTVHPSQFPYDDVLGGMRWQQEIEHRAYMLTQSYLAPAQRVGDFLAGKASENQGTTGSTYRPGVHWCDLQDVLPDVITQPLKEALPLLDGRLRGFAHPDAVLTAPETRSSSPVRIIRDNSRQSVLRGLYPTGEGAGYAGGIMSAAIDGIQSAEAIITALEREEFA